jgi:hypothetical protein
MTQDIKDMLSLLPMTHSSACDFLSFIWVISTAIAKAQRQNVDFSEKFSTISSVR